MNPFPLQLLSWFDKHGRKQLPWQKNKTPYRVWVSEIMLQQTQVATVIPYFERFMQRFSDIAALANAAEDEVLHLWAGLGYYSRARNLHRAAKMIMTEFDGCFPDTLENLLSLPGIGQSTAGAILSIAYNKPTPILDGNVKRVLSRFYGIREPVNDKATEKKMWALATQNTPTKRVADYTQAIMDLGATLCTRSKPNCATCPFVETCVAYAENAVNDIPAKKSTKKLPVRSATFLLARYRDTILLCKRPPAGIWGGLWSLPELSGEPDQASLRRFCQQKLGATIRHINTLPNFRHTFSHYHLDIHPVCVTLTKQPAKVMESEQQIWYNLNQPAKLGLPKPVQLLLSELE